MSEKKHEQFGKRIKEAFGPKPNAPEIAGLFGCAPETIYAWMRGDQLPHGENLLRLKELYSVCIDELLTGKPCNKFSSKCWWLRQSLETVVSVANQSTKQEDPVLLIKIFERAIETLKNQKPH